MINLINKKTKNKFLIFLIIIIFCLINILTSITSPKPKIYKDFFTAAKSNWVGDGVIIGHLINSTLKKDIKVDFAKQINNDVDIKNRIFPYVVESRISIYAHPVEIDYTEYNISMTNDELVDLLNKCNSLSLKKCEIKKLKAKHINVKILKVENKNHYIVKKIANVNRSKPKNLMLIFPITWLKN